SEWAQITWVVEGKPPRARVPPKHFGGHSYLAFHVEECPPPPSPAECLHRLVGDVEVRPDVLDVVGLLERVHQPEHLVRRLPLEVDRGLREHSHFRGADTDSLLFQDFLDLVENFTPPPD